VIAAGLGFWVRFILRKPVGEVPPSRHLVTVIAVTVGSYLWLVAPGLLTLFEISKIKNVELSEGVKSDDRVALVQLNADLDTLSLYRSWRCIPPGKESEIQKLCKLADRYYVSGYCSGSPVNQELEPAADDINCVDKRSWRTKFWPVYSIRRTILAIKDAWGLPSEEHPFSIIRESWVWLLIAALGFGLFTAMFSYPSYVWRRIFF
jgi:hypothetical protein